MSWFGAPHTMALVHNALDGRTAVNADAPPPHSPISPAMAPSRFAPAPGARRASNGRSGELRWRGNPLIRLTIALCLLGGLGLGELTFQVGYSRLRVIVWSDVRHGSTPFRMVGFNHGSAIVGALFATAVSGALAVDEMFRWQAERGQ